MRKYQEKIRIYGTKHIKEKLLESGRNRAVAA